MKFNMHPFCNIVDFDIKRGMAPLLMTANYSLHDVRHLMYLGDLQPLLQETSNAPEHTAK